VGIQVLGWAKGKMTEIMMGRKAAKKKAIRDSKWVSVEAVEEVKT